MTVNFAEYFSAEQGGYELLYQNMKSGLSAGRDLADFLRERSAIEETNSKLLAKVAKQAGQGQGQGAFGPVWAALRVSAERLSALHLHMFHKVGELVKDVSRYADDLHKKHKAVKDSEAGTLEAAVAAQAARQALHKAEDACHAKAAELDKLREAGSARDLDRLEAKLRKLRDDRAGLQDRHAAAKRDFEKRMALTCKHFQDVEEAHLKQMKHFVSAFVDLAQTNHGLVGQVHLDLKHRCLEMTVESLLERFVLDKYGAQDGPSPGDAASAASRPASLDGESVTDRPAHQHPPEAVSSGPISAIARLASRKEPSTASKTSRRTTSLLNLFTPNFQSKDEPATREEAAPCSAPSSPSGAQADAAARTAEKADDSNVGRNPLRESKWFLRSRRTRAKLKSKSKKKGDAAAAEERSDPDEREEEVAKEAEAEAEAEREGGPVGSPEVDEDGYRVKPEDEKPHPHAHAYSTSDSDTEEEPERKIRVEIKPLGNGTAPMSASVDELLATVENMTLYPTGRRTSAARSGGDFLGLDPFRSPSGGDPRSPPSNRLGAAESPAPDFELSSEIADLGDRRSTATPSASSIAIPRPPSRRSEPGDFRAGIASGPSRGPSPLTIGMADAIPLAVAFHEIVHAYFRGSDETKCRVKMSGDLMLSFPMGIVGVLANNPNPAKLCFRLKNALRLEDVSPNARLIVGEPGRSLREGAVLEFDMPALTSLLKKQSEKNPTASYFNVDILKYRVRPAPGAASCPLQLVSYWKCERNHTDLKIDYKYNVHAMSSPSPLLNLSVAVPFEGGVERVNSKPQCRPEVGERGGAVWKFTELSQHSDDGGVGSLKARAELSSGPSPKGTVSAQFNCEGATLSGVDFELVGGGYRISLVKRKFVSGKYVCDGD